MENNWIILLKDIGVFGFIVWGVQKIISNSSERKFADYKSQLDIQLKSYQVQFDKEVKKYESELKTLADRLSSLHNERFKIIKEAYQKLVMLDSEMRKMTASFIPIIEDAKKEEEERIQNAQKAFADYNNFVLFNKIYFSPKTAELLESIIKEYKAAQWDFFEPKRLQSFTGGRPSPEGYREAIEKVTKASGKVQNDIPQIIALVEAEFRQIIGVE